MAPDETSVADPRDLAQQWLAQVIDDRMDRLISPVTGSALARAILDQPGVKVRQELWAMGEGTMPEPALSLPNYVEPTHRQIEILLPFEALGAPGAS